MPTCRVHILGASGSGTTTLGRELAGALAVPHHDSDDYFWLPTDPPYTEMRPAADRLTLMRELFLPRAAWVLSGSLAGWGDPLIGCFDLVVFLRTSTAIRVERLRRREATRYGSAAVAPGGCNHDRTAAFLDWAAGYDSNDLTTRSLQRHEAWLAGLSRPVLRLDGARPIGELAAAVMTRLHPDRMTVPAPGARSRVHADHGVPPA